MTRLSLLLVIVLLSAPVFAADAPPRMVLGPSATDSQGREGRLHTVAAGETLWDISEAYLGSPWVWPKLWNEEGTAGSAIQPGDVLWVSSEEIRRLTPSQVAQLKTSAPVAPPAAMASDMPAVGSGVVRGLDASTAMHGFGFITTRPQEFVGRVIGNPTERGSLGTGDTIYIDMGRGQAQTGDRFRIVRARRSLPDPDTGELLGTFVAAIGWAEVTQLEGEAAAAVIHGAIDEVHAGDLLLPAGDAGDPAALHVQSTPEKIEGEILSLVGPRVLGGGLDVVYLDRGTEKGLALGSALDIVRPGRTIRDDVRDRYVKVPDTVVGRMVVISARAESAAAYVVSSSTEVMRGDVYRGASVGD